MIATRTPVLNSDVSKTHTVINSFKMRLISDMSTFQNEKEGLSPRHLRWQVGEE